jgi:simple sugar transport system substrate-binding protein
MHTDRREFLIATAAIAATTAFRPALAAEQFKMGLLIPGSVADEGWNRIAYNALKGVENELGAKVSYVELQQNPASFEKAFRDYAAHGYNVILGHGFEFQDSALTVAEDYPDTWFLISSSSIHKGKVIGLNTDSSQPFYLMGVIAAKMGKAAGLIGGMEIPPIKEALYGFTKAVKDTKDIPVSSVYLGNFSDVGRAKEAAKNMISRGTDFVVPDADAAGVGVIQAVKEAGPAVCTFGVFTDITSTAPENILGTYLADYARGVIRIVAGIKDGTSLPKNNIDFGLKDEDVMKFYYNDNAKRAVPEDLRKYVEGIKAKIIAGEIKTLAT